MTNDLAELSNDQETVAIGFSQKVADSEQR